jgi:transposase
MLQRIPNDFGLTARFFPGVYSHEANRPARWIRAHQGALAVIPNNPSRALKYPLDKHLYAQRHLVECCFSKLKQFRRVATASKRPPEITLPSSRSLPSSYGCDKCPHHLECLRWRDRPRPWRGSAQEIEADKNRRCRRRHTRRSARRASRWRTLPRTTGSDQIRKAAARAGPRP